MSEIDVEPRGNKLTLRRVFSSLWKDWVVAIWRAWLHLLEIERVQEESRLTGVMGYPSWTKYCIAQRYTREQRALRTLYDELLDGNIVS